MISAREIVALLACGALAAVAISTLHLSVRIPGHAILRATLPMAAGIALVPRRSAGLVMAAGALITTGIMRLGGIGEIQSAALVSLLALGPMLDIALAGAPVGWKLYAHFAAAGAGANLMAFASRLAIALVFRGGGAGSGTGGGAGSGLNQLAGGHDFLSFWPLAFMSFTLCGAFAGLISAAVWFRSGHDKSP